MKTLYYQPACGISGDMHLAAMINLGVPQEHLLSELGKLGLGDQFSIRIENAQKMGISGTRAEVTATDQHDHRHHSTIVSMINAAGFAPGVTKRSLAIFAIIAEAEAKIHNIPIDEVHFHEVGAIDSIVDIVAAAICLEWINPDRVICAPVEVGSGFVNCAHGRFPVPAPATQEILSGIPCTYGTVTGESTTPTGAAILKATITSQNTREPFAPTRTGYGIGHKDFEVPNVLRVALGETQAAAGETETHFQIEANIDDMSAEAFEPLAADLLAAGARDVFFTPVIMKKSRPATCLTILADESHVGMLSDMVLNRSSTIGLRIMSFEKRILPRKELTVTTRYGPVNIKEVVQPDGRTRWKSEYDDIRRIADSTTSDFQTIKQEVDFDIRLARGAEPTN